MVRRVTRRSVGLLRRRRRRRLARQVLISDTAEALLPEVRRRDDATL